MIKTDKVIYRTRTQEEYDWLMNKMEADGIRWVTGNLLTKTNNWIRYSTETCIAFKGRIMMFADFDFYNGDSDFRDYEIIEVSDLMEDGEVQNKLKAIHKQLTSQINDLRKQGKEPKAVEYTIKVCFE